MKDMDGIFSEETDFENRIVDSSYTPADSETELSLRPKTLDAYVGQTKAKEHLKICIDAAKMRGESLDRLNRSVTKGTYGIFVVEAGTIPPMEGHSPCVSCGACVLVCPARLKPSNLSRYAEFALHERCRAEHIESCLECGLCGYVCIARRPVLQYIRLAKRKLAEMERDKGLVELKTKQL